MKSTEILNSLQVSLTIKRLCHQLIENHHNFSKSVLIGLQPNGIFLANRLKSNLEISIQDEVRTGSLDITFFRDDFRRKEKPLIPSVTNIDFSIENKKVIFQKYFSNLIFEDIILIVNVGYSMLINKKRFNFEKNCKYGSLK